MILSRNFTDSNFRKLPILQVVGILKRFPSHAWRYPHIVNQLTDKACSYILVPNTNLSVTCISLSDEMKSE